MRRGAAEQAGLMDRSGYDAQRAGQAFMNELYKLDPDFHKTVTETELDCFYKSGILPKTMKAWMEHLQKQG